MRYVTSLALTYSLALGGLGTWLVFAWMAPWSQRHPRK